MMTVRIMATVIVTVRTAMISMIPVTSMICRQESWLTHQRSPRRLKIRGEKRKEEDERDHPKGKRNARVRMDISASGDAAGSKAQRMV